jgi:hypothetical protein
MSAVITEPDTDADFRADRMRVRKVSAEFQVNEYLVMLGVPPEGCAKCLEEVRAVLRNYEPS